MLEERARPCSVATLACIARLGGGRVGELCGEPLSLAPNEAERGDATLCRPAAADCDCATEKDCESLWPSDELSRRSAPRLMRGAEEEKEAMAGARKRGRTRRTDQRSEQQQLVTLRRAASLARCCRSLHHHTHAPHNEEALSRGHPASPR